MNPSKTFLLIVLSALFLSNSGLAADNDTVARQEIQQLIQAVEQSGCTFHRNGKAHDAQDGADHLRLKLKRGGKYADTAEHFIERLASKSSWTGKAYMIELPNGQQQTMQSWLNAELVKVREEKRD
jgi:hypothetical protein